MTVDQCGKRNVKTKNMYEIEKKIPVPNKLKADSFPFAQMEVEDSFFVPCSKDKCSSVSSNLLLYAKKWALNHNKDYKFKCKRSHEPSGIRIWRIE